MSKKKSIIEKIASGKGFYITAALSFALIVAAIAFVYNSSMDMLRDLDIPTTIEQAEKNQQGVTDPRKYDDEELIEDVEHPDEENSVEEVSRQSTTAAVSAEKATTETTTQEATEPVEVFSNDSYVYPLTGDIDRAFSATPVYDETMEDWRIHKGTDFACEPGAQVTSIGNGKVVKVISDPSLGYCIEVDYGDFIARYCGMEQGTTVIVEDTVSKGDIIGKVGSIPCESKQESHLHFEIVRSGACEDPMKVIGG